MKKLLLSLMVICALLAFYPVQSNATTPVVPTTIVAENPAEAARAKTLLLRLDEIKAMDKSSLKSSEKRVLRKEVREIKQELKTMGSGVYVSVGAVIIIILLLILLL